jgi:hypothetical protein
MSDSLITSTAHTGQPTQFNLDDLLKARQLLETQIGKPKLPPDPTLLMCPSLYSLVRRHGKTTLYESFDRWSGFRVWITTNKLILPDGNRYLKPGEIILCSWQHLPVVDPVGWAEEHSRGAEENDGLEAE